MTQSYIDQLVAAATGDELREIRRLGFSLVSPTDVELEDDAAMWSPEMVDWDEVDRHRRIPVAA